MNKGKGEIMEKKEVKKMNHWIQRFKQTTKKNPRYTFRELKVLYLTIHQLTLDEVEEEHFVSWLSLWEQEGFLKGIKNSGTFTLRSGQTYFGEYFLKERVIESSIDVEAWFQQSHPILQEVSGYYLKNQAMFEEDEEWLNLINQKLHQWNEALATPLTINQRSYQLFQNEKLLSGDEKGRTTESETRLYTVLKNLNLIGNPKALNYFVPMHYPVVIDFYRPQPKGRVLIVENQDPFHTLIQLEQQEEEFPFDGLVLGSGSEIESTFRYIEQNVFKGVFSMPETVFYYAGDLDLYGLRIFNRLKQRYPNMKLAYLPNYLPVLYEKSKQLGSRPNTQGLPNELDWEQWLLEQQISHWFGTEETHQGIQKLLNAEQMVPQEVMTVQDWKTYLDAFKLNSEGER